MPAVNSQVLVWARETAGLTLHEAAAKVGIRGARGVAAVDRLAALERGDERPTRPMLVKMARQYRRPLLAFYLNGPPRRDDGGPEFRTLPGAGSPKTDALVSALVRRLRSRQSMVRAAMEAEDEADPLPFVGALARRIGGDAGLKELLQRRTDRMRLTQLAVKMLARLFGEDLRPARCYAEPTAEDLFRLLRARAEASGVFVLLAGDLGSHHTALDVVVFRGFALADDMAPFVIINSNDSKPAWSFTLLHEMTHLLLGRSGFGGTFAARGIERLCNDVASEWLLPSSVLDQIAIPLGADTDEQQSCIARFSRERNLSRTMVAYRLLCADRIDRATFRRLRARYREHWRQARDRQRAKNRDSDGGPTYYVVRRHRAGPRLLDFTRRMLDSRALSTTKAARILGVKPSHVGEMVRPSTPRQT